VEDLPSLVDHFIRRSRPHAPPAMPVVAPGVMEVLAAHQWPGNVRELANVLEHAIVLCDELPVGVDHLPARLGRPVAAQRPASPVSSPLSPPVNTAPAVESQPSDRPPTLREIELKEIVERLKRNGGNKVKTAEELGISLKTLYNKLHQVQANTLDRTA
jgi:two-component system NtrC family response regulator